MGTKDWDVEEDGQAGADSAPASVPLELLGTHQNTLDDKRRIAIPKRFRPHLDLSGELVISRQLGGDSCLALWPAARFAERMQALQGLRASSLGVGNKTVRAYLRMVLASAERVKPDRQARISLTREQCALVGIEREVAFLGSGDHLELWAPEQLNPEHDDEDFAALTAQLFG